MPKPEQNMLIKAYYSACILRLWERIISIRDYFMKVVALLKISTFFLQITAFCKFCTILGSKPKYTEKKPVFTTEYKIEENY